METLFLKFAIRFVCIQPKTHSKKQNAWDKSPEGEQKEQIPRRSLQLGADFFLERTSEPCSLFLSAFRWMQLTREFISSC